MLIRKDQLQEESGLGGDVFRKGDTIDNSIGGAGNSLSKRSGLGQIIGRAVAGEQCVGEFCSCNDRPLWKRLGCLFD